MVGVMASSFTDAKPPIPGGMKVADMVSGPAANAATIETVNIGGSDYKYVSTDDNSEGKIFAFVSANSYAYTGEAIKPAVVLVQTVDGQSYVTLEQNTHYTVSYSNNVNHTHSGNKALIEIGCKDGNGTIDFKPFAIQFDIDQMILNEPVISSKELTYTGSELDPQYNVSFSTTVDNANKTVNLVRGVDADYTISPETVINPGDQTVTLTLVKGDQGNYKFAGNSSPYVYNGYSFTVNKRPITGSSIVDEGTSAVQVKIFAELDRTSYMYNGTAQFPNVTVYSNID